MILHTRSSFLETPIGILEIAATERGLTSVAFVEKMGKDGVGFSHLDAAKKQFEEYFDGKRRAFTNLPLSIIGTAFSQDVWKAVGNIPFGRTLTYGQVASLVKNGGAARAVGRAVGRNPLAIIIPCHRIMPSDGSLGGFAWGAERKKWLLNHERTFDN